jgi:putative MATE family efflux protein
MDRTKLLGEEKIGKLLWDFSIPAMVGMIVNALYNIVDSIFVGNGVGEIGLTAVTIAFPIMIILMAFGMFIGVGATALVSIRLGERRLEEAEKILGNALSLVCLASLILTPIGLYFLDPILIALGASVAVLPYAHDFTQVIIMGNIFMFLGFGLNNLIRAEGNPRLAMATMLISAGLNTLLNPLFIFGLKWGIVGSAFATVLSQAAAAFWVLAYFVSNKSVLKFRRKNFVLNKSIVIGIVAIGLSPFLMQVAASVISFLSNVTLLEYGGDLAVAAMGIITRVAMLILMPIFGMQQGVQPIIGYNYGAQNYGRVIEALKKAIFGATIIATGGFLIVQLFDKQIISIFNSNQELVNFGAQGLRIYLALLPIIGFQIISANYFQAVGKAKYAILFSMSRQVIILIPLLIILPHFLGIYGVWVASPIADFFSSLITGVYLWRELGKLTVLHKPVKLN